MSRRHRRRNLTTIRSVIRGTPIIAEYKPYIDLAGAILRQAREDYVHALIVDNRKETDALEEFFLCRYGQLLSFGQGKYIIECCKIEVALYRRKRRGHSFWITKD